MLKTLKVDIGYLFNKSIDITVVPFCFNRESNLKETIVEQEEQLQVLLQPQQLIMRVPEEMERCQPF